MSTEAQTKFTLVGAHRQLHADAAKHLARLEGLINEASNIDEIVAEARSLAIANVAVDIFEHHMEKHHSGSPAEPKAVQKQPAAPVPQVDRPVPQMDRQKVVDRIKKLTEARGSIPLAAMHSQSSPAASAKRQSADKKPNSAGRNNGNTDNKKDLYGEPK